MPAASHFAEAQANDEDLAREHLGRETPEYRPRISEWNPMVAELANAVDRIGELIAVQIARAGKPPPRIRPRPRPRTAIDRVRTEQREQQHRDLVARVLPHRAPDEPKEGRP